MPHCTKCGTEVAATAQFCPTCGQPQSAIPPASPPLPASTGITENTAAALSYALGWFTGIIFFLIDKRPYVRYHAAQSIVTFGGLHVIRIVLGITFGVGWFWGTMRPAGFFMALPILALLGVLSFVLWIYCMVKASQGVRFKLPVAGDVAEGLAGRG